MAGLFFCLLIINAVMLISIIMFETSSKKIIFWSLLVAITSIFAYLPYLIFFSDKWYIKNELKVKAKEDKIYKELVDFKLEEKDAKCDLINFAKKTYGANFYNNSKLEIFSNKDEFNNNILKDIESANQFIIIDTQVFMDSINKESLTQTLIEKNSLGVKVKVIYSKKQAKDKEFIKELKENRVRVCRFNRRQNNLNRYYKNNKNIISVDGKVCYLYSRNKTIKSKMEVEYLDLFYRLQGEIVKGVDLEAHLDTTYSTNKFFDLPNYSITNISSTSEYQYIASSIENNFLDLVIKAIITAKKSITLHFDKFIPHESILEAIKLAVKSGVKVKAMISNVNRQYGYYTTRSYIKELASVGAICYFYDGHINSNYAIFDDEVVIFGTISMVSQNLLCDLQDVMIVNDNKIVQQFIDKFNNSINNSYKLNNAKRVLFRERFFRKFMG